MGSAEIMIIVLVAVVVMWFLSRRSRYTPPDSSAWGDLAGIRIDADAARDPRVQEAIASGSTIRAIQIYRELTGVGLKEARDAVEYLAQNPAASVKKHRPSQDSRDAGIRDMVQTAQVEEAVEVYRQFAGVDEYTARDAVEEIGREQRLQETGEDSFDDSEIRALIASGQKVVAIKRYRELTGVGLKEAVDAVDRLERNLY